MTTPRRNLFDEIQRGLREYRGGKATLVHREFSEPDVRAVRATLGLTQQQLAAVLDVSVRTLQNWEQNRRSCSGPLRTLLRVLQSEPQAVLRAMRPAVSRRQPGRRSGGRSRARSAHSG